MSPLYPCSPLFYLLVSGNPSDPQPPVLQSLGSSGSGFILRSLCDCLRDPLLLLATVSGPQEAGIGQDCPHPPPLKDFSCLLSVKFISWGYFQPTGTDSYSRLSPPLPLRSQGVRACAHGHVAHVLLVVYGELRTYGSASWGSPWLAKTDKGPISTSTLKTI